MSRTLRLKLDGISAEERAYLLGLYLADGSAPISWNKGGGRNWRTIFLLQWNEREIAEKVAEILRRLGLRPHYEKPSKGERMLTVRVYSKELFSLLPRKKRLIRNAVVREEFLAENGAYGVEKGIPFLAGLLDGDGFCQVSVQENGAVGLWKWGLCQNRCLFLLDYAKRFVESLTKDERSVRVEVSPNGQHKACIRKLGVVALLSSGIEKCSWKASRWLRWVGEIRDERMKYYTTGQVAAMFGVCREYVRSLLETGKLRHVRGTGKARESHTPASQFRSCYFIPIEEANKLGEKLREDRERTDKAKRQGVTLVDLVKSLDVPLETLRNWRRRGGLQGTVVKERSKGHRRRLLVISREEVERIKGELTKSRERTKKIRGEGLPLEDVAKILGIKRNTLDARYRRGKLSANLVREGKHRYLVIPRDEVERMRE